MRDVLNVEAFMSGGFAKIEQAAPRSVADAARAALWRQLGLSPDDPAGWSEPVRWAADLTGQGPFGELVRSPVLAQALGPDPVALAAMGRLVDEASATRSVVHATGEPGDMYLVHPFTVHAADEHRGRTPRFMAQAPVGLRDPLTPASSSPLACVWENC